MKNKVKNSWPSFGREEANIVKKILLSNKVNYHTGSKGKQFEKNFAKYIGCKYALTFSNGTTALEAAFNALDIKKGDEVIVTSRTYIASVSSIINCGATPIFVDVEIDSQNINPNLIENLITKKTKAIMCVHLSGMPCEMKLIKKISKKNLLYIIEDCSQAHGAKYNSTHVGSIGDIGTWSFCNDKIMSTGGEGGMVTFNKKNLYNKIWSFRDHGKSHNKFYQKTNDTKFKWIHDGIGTNARLTETQSGIGIYQLKKLDYWIKQRKNNNDLINKVCNKFTALRTINVPNYITHAYYKCYVFVIPNNLYKGWNRNRIIKEINNEGINCFTGSCSEVYLEKSFTNMFEFNANKNSRLTSAKILGETSLMFEIHPTLTKSDMRIIASSINKVMIKASPLRS